MTSQEKGAKFEKTAKEYFVWLFEEIGFIVTKERVQFSGTQDGFDIQLIVVLNNFERTIYIECKNYSSDLDIGNIFKKAWDLEKNYHLTENDLFIAILPKTNFKNADNSEKSSPVLNDKFDFKSYQLDKSNGIQELFALNQEFYKEIYDLELDFEVDKLKEIEKFKSIIYSRKPFKKIFLSESDKEKYLTQITLNDKYIHRTIAENLDNLDGELSLRHLLGLNNGKTLSDVTENEDRILILGNPGLGKSTELKEFALSKWKTGEQNDYTPIFKNLKNFTTSNSIDDFLPENFKDILNCYFIFDGIDEIKDSQDFISKLEEFIENNKSEVSNYKYILSCRTNIYESVVKNISGFKIYYLRNLSNDDGFKLLRSRLDHSEILDKLSFKTIHYDFLKNPFLIGILADYINRNSSLPHNSIELWESYISKRLEFDSKEKLKKLSINIPLITKISKKVSLISELMKSNSIKEKEIFDLIPNGGEYSEYLRNPLIEKDSKNDSWSFEHRNIQEYFAAKYLSELSYYNIINFISITGNETKENLFVQAYRYFFGSNEVNLNKTHPTLFNTVTFLLNIIDQNKSEDIIKWLEKNEPEILFTADTDRITLPVKIRVFQNYFKKTCIENTFWIEHNRSFGVERIGKFGDCEENFQYLLSIFENSNNHFRVIISALELMAYMSLTPNNKDKFFQSLLSKLKDTSIDLTKSVENDLKIKSHIISCIQKFKIHIDEPNYLNQVLDAFKDEDNEEINHSLLYLVNSIENVDDYFEFVFEEFLRVFKIKKRKGVDKFYSSRGVIEDIVLRINSSDNFLRILNYLLDDENSFYHNFEDSFVIQIFEKCNVLAQEDNSIVEKILDMVKTRKYFSLRENELVKFIIATNSTSLALNKYLSDNNIFEHSKYLIAQLLSSENIGIMINKFIDDKAIPKDIEVFRNILGHNDIELALSFENTMKGKGITFSEKLFTEDDRINSDKERLIKIKHNFDLLFDNTQLSIEIKKIFKEIDLDEISWDDICQYQSAWYSKNGHSMIIDTSLVLLRHLIRDNGNLSYDESIKLIEDEYILMTEIRRLLSGNKTEFTITTEQETRIKDWCLESIKNVDFEKMILIRENHNYSVFLDYYICKNIYGFQRILKFDLPQEFYLNILRYSDLESFNNEESQFESIRTKINNKEIFDKQVVENINNNLLHSLSLKSHIKYSLENNLTNTYEKIEYYLLTDHSLYFQNENLTIFYEKTKSIDFLKKCCNDISSGLCWESIKLMLKLDNTETFILEKARGYLTLNADNYRMNALGVLFKFNQPDALNIFLNFIKQRIGESIKLEYYINYNNVEGLKIIEDFYITAYGNYNSEDIFEHHYAKELYKSYIYNLSRKDLDSFQKTQKIFNKIKKKLKKEKQELFFINSLIENSIDSYINSKSMPLEFNEAKTKVEAYIN